MGERYQPSSDAVSTRQGIEQRFGWREPQQPLHYAPSPDQVLPEEATTEQARGNADRFILGLVQAVAPPDDPTPLLLTADEVRSRYDLHASQMEPDAIDTFTLLEAWGAAERMRRHAHELVQATDDWSYLSLGRHLHRVADCIEDALPEHERPLPF